MPGSSPTRRPARAIDSRFTCSTSQPGKSSRAGCHINAVEAIRLEAGELDDVAVGRCEFVATDSIEQAKEEGGDVVGPMKRGVIAWGGIHEISEVVAGKIAGRTKADDITL